MEAHQVGDTIKITTTREGAERQFKVKLSEVQ
jgi:hypothetical protein